MVVAIFHMHTLLCINIFVKTKNAKNEYIIFYIQLNMFFCMKFFDTCCQHFEPQIIILVNIENQPNGKKKESLSLLLFQNGFCNFQNSYIIYYSIKCII
jgi:hypothetical protein